MYVAKIMYVPYKNEFLGWKRSKKIVSEISILYAFIEKPRIKHLKNIDLLHELPFYDEILIKYHKHLEDMQEVIKLK